MAQQETLTAGLSRMAQELIVKLSSPSSGHDEALKRQAMALAVLGTELRLKVDAAGLWTGLGLWLVGRPQADAAQLTQALAYFDESSSLLSGSTGEIATRTLLRARAGSASAWMRLPVDAEVRPVDEALAAARAALAVERPAGAAWDVEDGWLAAVWGDLLAHAGFRDSVTAADSERVRSFAEGVLGRNPPEETAYRGTFALALAMLRLEDQADGLTTLRNAVVLAEASGYSFEAGRALSRLANATVELDGSTPGQDAAALQQRAAEHFADADSPAEAADSWRTAAVIHAAAGDWERALEAFSQSAQAWEDALPRALLRPDADRVRWHLAYAEQATVLCLVRLRRAGDAAAAAEQARAKRLRALPRSFSPEFLRVRERAPLLATAYFDAERQVRVAEMAEAELRERPDTATVEDLDHVSCELGKARRARATALGKMRAVPGLESSFGPFTPAEIQTALPNGAAAAYVVATPYGGIALVVSKAAVTPVELTGLTNESLSARLSSNVAAYSAWQAHPRDRAAMEAFTRELDETGRWLWQAVMGDLVEAARGLERVIVLGSGGLDFLPLHAAWREEGDGRRSYAIDALAISSLPCVALLPPATDAAIGNDLKMLMVADPEPTSYDELPQALLEAAAIAPAFSSTTLAEAQATRTAIADALPAADLVHLACHATADFGTPYRSHLVLACDQPLALSDIVELDLSRRPEVFLSACESSLHDFELADEVQSIAAGFLSAGATSVVSTLWPVYDLSASLAAVTFYGRRLAGAGTLAALRGTQRWMRDSSLDAKVTAVEGMAWLAQDVRASLVGALQATPLDLSSPISWAPYVYSGA